MKIQASWALAAMLLCTQTFAGPVPPATPAASAPSLDDFYATPDFDSAKLSPNGRFLAYVQTTPDMTALVVKNLDTDEAHAIESWSTKGNTKGLTIDWLEWKDDNRLVLGLTLLDITRRGDKPDDDIKSYRYGRFLVALDRDGKNELKLLKGNFWNPQHGFLVALLDRLKDDPDHILATSPDIEGNSEVWKINVRNGEAVKIEPGDSTVTAWRTDSAGNVLVRYRVWGQSLIIEGRATNAAPWTTIAKIRAKDLKEADDFEILGAAEKPSQFYVTVRPKDASEGDVRSLRIYDIATKTLSGPVWPALNYDITNIVYDGDTSRLAGVCYTIEVYVCDFRDPHTTAIFKGLLTYFEGDRNIVPISFSNDGRWWLLDVSGPTEPSGYYLFDTTNAKIELLGERYQKLPAEQLGVMRRFAYRSRDGVQISGYLTRPPNAGAGPMPLIVMPHGGPEVRDSFGYDRWSQIMATRGYLVFQPNFRGSGGYGVSFAEAGYRQWGGLMADDITDGVRSLIASGQADPSRICIFGASFGGYAALYAGATHPELYKCVVSIAGDADLIASMRFERETYGKDSSTYHYWLKLMGDPDKDADRMRAASPATYAGSYKPSVLLIHGEDDDIVDPEQSKIMNRALKRAGRDVKLILFKNEGHPEFATEIQKTAFADVIDFIEAHIAPSGPSAVTAQAGIASH